jgi:hypothetical protein
MALVLLAACTDDDSAFDGLVNDGAETPATGPINNDGNTGSNQVNYGGQIYALSAGLEEVFRPDDNHSSSQLNISNGEFYSVQVPLMGQLKLIWRARNATVWLYVNMYSPGTAALSGGTFSFAPRNTNEDDPVLASSYFFKKGKFAIDLNGDGQIESDDEEFLNVTGGTMTLTVSGALYTVEFNWTLENGVNATGSFSGDFSQV